MDVSVIIVNYNTTALTRQCIASVKAFTRLSYEIILVDNASKDRSILGLAQEFPGLVLIAQKENLGFGRANNAGIEIAKGKYVFLLNSDTYLLNDAIDVLFHYMEQPQHQHVGCSGGDLFAEDGNKQTSYGHLPSIAEAIGALGFLKLNRSWFDRHLSSGVKNKEDRIREVGYICGADSFIRKSVLEKTGAFDPRFFLYYEETELSYRIKKSGYISVLVPQAKIVHLEGGSQTVSDDFNFRKIEIYSASRTLYFKLCFGPLTAFLSKVIYAVQALIFFIVKRKSGYLKTAGIIM